MNSKFTFTRKRERAFGFNCGDLKSIVITRLLKPRLKKQSFRSRVSSRIPPIILSVIIKTALNNSILPRKIRPRIYFNHWRSRLMRQRGNTVKDAGTPKFDLMQKSLDMENRSGRVALAMKALAKAVIGTTLLDLTKR